MAPALRRRRFNGEEGNACPRTGDAPGIVGEGRRGVKAAGGKLASGRRREDAVETGMDSKRRRDSISGSGARRSFAFGATMEEPGEEFGEDRLEPACAGLVKSVNVLKNRKFCPIALF